MRAPVRIAGVAFANARPLVDGLEDQPGVELVRAEPAVCADRLAAGEVDVALVPVAALLAHPEWRPVSRGVIASERRVRSVLLIDEEAVGPGALRTLVASRASRTSNALAALLCRLDRGPGGPPLDVVSEGDPTRGPVGRVVIGDRALGVDPEARGVIDLVDAWRRRTGLPFVFARFAAGPRIAGDEDALALLERLLDRARGFGLSRLDDIARTTAADLAIDPALARTYFRRHLHFEMTPPDADGLDAFARLVSPAMPGTHDASGGAPIADRPPTDTRLPETLPCPSLAAS